ncbi:MAG: hypothetical protein QM605_12240 [Sphingobium sp.]
MNDDDDVFAVLRSEPVPAMLASIDRGVIAGLAAGRERVAARRGLVLACGIAALIGLWGGLALPVGADGHGHHGAMPLLSLPDAAPSHRLAI